MGAVGAIAQVAALALEVIRDHINDPKSRERAIANYIHGLRKLKESLKDATDIEEIDNILLTIIDTKP